MNIIKIIFVIFIIAYAKRYSKGGTYRYVNKRSGKTHYVGATNNFDRRHNQHRNDGAYYTSSNYEYKKNYMGGASKSRVADKERDLINKYKPSANKRNGGGGL